MIVPGILVWLILCLIVGSIGEKRQIGFGWAFFLSIILSPIIGLIIVLFSERKSELEFRKQTFELQKENNKLLNNTSSNTIIEELSKLQSLREKGVINEDEFLTMKAEILQKKSNDDNTAQPITVDLEAEKSINSLLIGKRKSELQELTYEELEVASSIRYLDKTGRVSDEDKRYIDQLIFLRKSTKKAQIK